MKDSVKRLYELSMILLFFMKKIVEFSPVFTKENENGKYESNNYVHD